MNQLQREHGVQHAKSFCMMKKKICKKYMAHLIFTFEFYIEHPVMVNIGIYMHVSPIFALKLTK